MADDVLLFQAVLLFQVPLVPRLFRVDQLHRFSLEVLSGQALLDHLVLLGHRLNPAYQKHSTS